MEEENKKKEADIEGEVSVKVSLKKADKTYSPSVWLLFNDSYILNESKRLLVLYRLTIKDNLFH